MSDDKKLLFLYNKIDIPAIAMHEWMKVPEFVQDMLDKVSKSETIDNWTVYKSMEEIYWGLERQKESGNSADVSYRLLRRSMTRLRNKVQTGEDIYK